MSEDRMRDRTLALAGLLQSAILVQQLARKGQADADLMQKGISTLFKMDAHDVVEIYGGADQLRSGLSLISDNLFNPKSASQTELMRYCIQLIQLAKKLKASTDISMRIAKRLSAASYSYEHKNFYSENELIIKLSSIYSDLISPLQPKIIVNGEHGYLSQQTIAAQVRVNLLCGIRSAHLWWQMGGTRLQLLTSRKQYQRQAQQCML